MSNYHQWLITTAKFTVSSKKKNPENNKEVYSLYITYENEIQASTAILCFINYLLMEKIYMFFMGQQNIVIIV